MSKTLIQKYIEENGYFIATPVGTSMWPLLRNRRDTVYLIKYNGELKKYDIPIYIRTTGEQVMHRCMGKDNNGYIMCGDNQSVKEYGIKDEQIIAVAKGIYRDEKYIPCTNVLYRFFVRVWCMNLRLRAYMLLVLRHTKSWKIVNEEVWGKKEDKIQ